MITYDDMIDISWLRGMQIQGIAGPWFIAEAKQQTEDNHTPLGDGKEDQRRGLRQRQRGNHEQRDHTEFAGPRHHALPAGRFEHGGKLRVQLRPAEMVKQQHQQRRTQRAADHRR